MRSKRHCPAEQQEYSSSSMRIWRFRIQCAVRQRPHWTEVFESHNCQVIEVGLSHEVQNWLACPHCCWFLPMDNELIDGLWLFDEDLLTWNIVLEIHLEDLHQVLELRCIFPISRPEYNHHLLFEDIEPLGSIDDPCGNFLQLEIMAGVVLDYHCNGRLLFSWKDIFELLLHHFWNFHAEESKILA